jgi:hypothetical protein
MRIHILGLLASAVLVSSASLAQAPDEAKPSTYAPADDLVRQVKTYVESLTAATSDADAYDEDKQGEVSRDANTLAAIALVLGMHDQESPLKPAASKLIAAANKLSADHADAKQAAQAVASIKAIVDKPEKGEAVAWKASAEIGPLMKQVPIVNNNLRRGVAGRRFAQSADKNAALAATLAAIAQASMFDTNYVSDDADKPLWIKICAEMRDGSAEALTAIRKGDQEAAAKAMDKIVKSCDDCHHKFRD